MYFIMMTLMTRLVVSGSSDNTIRLWDIECGACLRTLEGHEELVRCIRYHSYLCQLFIIVFFVNFVIIAIFVIVAFAIVALGIILIFVKTLD